MSRVIREHLRDVIAVLALVAAGIFATAVILTGQRASMPEWLPLLGVERFELKAEFASAQSITPGQGQTVDIAGVNVGDVSRVELEGGHAVVTMEIDEEDASLIHEDATLLLRPKTGLNDMVLALDPGSEGSPTIEEGDTVPLAATQPNVNPDEFLAVLDADTRSFLKLLLAGGAEGLGGRGRQLASALRRFEPTARDLARINRDLAKRRESVARSIHNFRLLTEALADTDGELVRFVDSSNAVLGSFARQEASLRGALRELPSALRATLGALRSNSEFSLEAGPALRRLLPMARALGPALRALRPFFRQTVGPIRDQLKPFTRQVRRPVTHTAQAIKQLGAAAPPLRNSTAGLNRLLNALAYNPGGQNEGYLFWLPWLNHTTVGIFGQDAAGILRRGMVLIGCNTTRLAESLVATDAFVDRPALRVLYELNRVPTPAEICP